MAGDFYAHFDSQAKREFEWAWPPVDGIFFGHVFGDYREQTLYDDSTKAFEDLLKVITCENPDNTHGRDRFEPFFFCQDYAIS